MRAGARLVIVHGHPREQDEGAPIVAEVADNERPHGCLGQQQLPRYRLPTRLRAETPHKIILKQFG